MTRSTSNICAHTIAKHQGLVGRWLLRIDHLSSSRHWAMNGMKLMRSCHIVAWLGRIRVDWCDSRLLMIRTTNGSPGSGSTKQRSLRMNSFFVKTQLQEGQQNRSICDPLLVNERYSWSYDKWREQRRAPLLVLLRRLPRMRALGLLLQLPLRVLLHHRPHGLGALLSRRASSRLDELVVD